MGHRRTGESVSRPLHAVATRRVVGAALGVSLVLVIGSAVWLRTRDAAPSIQTVVQIGAPGTGDPLSPYKSVDAPLPANAAHPTTAADPIISVRLRYTVADAGPEIVDEKDVLHESVLQRSVLFETTIDSNGNFVERSLDSQTELVKDYRDGQLTLLIGDQIERSLIEPSNRPYQPRWPELTRFRAGYVADRQNASNAEAARAGRPSDVQVSAVDCGAGPPCVQVVFSRETEVTEAERSLAYKVGLNQERSVLVYDPSSLITWYYKEEVNGKPVHEFRLLSLDVNP